MLSPSPFQINNELLKPSNRPLAGWNNSQLPLRFKSAYKETRLVPGACGLPDYCYALQRFCTVYQLLSYQTVHVLIQPTEVCDLNSGCHSNFTSSVVLCIKVELSKCLDQAKTAL